MGAIFLSHASADSAAAADLAAHLQSWGHRSLFLDVDPAQGIAAGADWEAELYRQLKTCRAVIALLSDAWLASRWCFAEVTQARALGKVVVPVLIAPCSPGDSLLADRQVVDLTGDREQGLARLRHGLGALGLGDDLPFDPERPYPGLASFSASDAGVYFGREPERDRLLDLLERMRRRGEPRLAVVLGASGCGKSSLVRAGVLPRLRRDAEGWLVVPPLRPGGDPRRALASVLAAAFDAAGAPRDWRAVAARLEDDGRPWTALADDLRQAAGRHGATVLLVLDQLEELLTTPDAAFLAALGRELGAPGGPLLALATLRSDFLAAFQRRPELRDLPFADLPLGPMPLDRLPRVIEGPAARVGLEIEEGLTARLTRDTASDDALPLLAFVLRELWERRSGERWTFALYEGELGTIEGAVGRIAEDVAGELRAAEEDALRTAFLRLVRLDDAGRLVRRPARWDDLPAAAHPLLDRFVAGGLLVSTEVDGERSLEVAHEALFRAWDRLARWLDEARELLLFRRRLTRARHEWRRTGEDPGALLRGAALAEAERWLAERRDELDDDERRYVRASAAAERRRRRRLVSALAAGLLVALGLGTFASVQWWRAEGARRQAVAGQLATQADAALDDSADGLVHSLLLATESLRAAWTHDGYGAWARAVALLPPPATKSVPAEGMVTALAVHPERPWVALAADGEDGVLVVDFATGADVTRLDHPSPTYLLRFSPDGHWLAAVVGDRISVWRVDTWRLTRRLRATDHVENLVFTGEESRRGPELVVAARDALLHLPPLPDDELPAPMGGALSVAFHPHVAGGRSAGPTLAVGRSYALSLRTWPPDSEHSETVVVQGFPVNVAAEELAFTADGIWLLVASGDRVCPRNLRGRLVPQRGDFREGVCFEHDALGLTGLGSHRRMVTLAGARWPAERWLLAQTTGHPATLHVWRGDGPEMARLPVSGGAAFALQEVGDWLVTAGDGADLRRLADLGLQGAAVRLPPAAAVAFSPDGRWLASAGEGTVRLHRVGTWDETTSEDARSARRGSARHTVLAFDAHGELLIILEGPILRLFELDGDQWTPTSRVDLGDRPVDRVALSPDGLWLRTESPYGASLRAKILTSPSRTTVWSTEDGERVAWRSNETRDVQDFLAELEPFFGAVSREDVQLEWKDEGWRGEPLGAGGRRDLLTTADGWPEISLRPPPRRSDSPDGRWSADGDGLLTEQTTGREVVTLGGRDDRVQVFAPDRGDGSEWLALAGPRGVDVHRLGPVDALVDEACRRLPRNLRPEEWPLDGAPPVTCPGL